MKFPHVTLALLAGLLVFSSCEDDVISSNAEPTVDRSVEKRCCDDDITSHPLYAEIYGDFLTGLIDPSLSLIDALTAEYLESISVAYQKCIDSGTEFEVCFAEFESMLQVKTYLDNLNWALIDSMQNDFPDLDDYDFFSELVASFEIGLGDRVDVPCYRQYQADVDAAVVDLLADIANGRLGAPFKYIGRLLQARKSYCGCLFQHYNHICP